MGSAKIGHSKAHSKGYLFVISKASSKDATLDTEQNCKKKHPPDVSVLYLGLSFPIAGRNKFSDFLSSATEEKG